MYHFYIYSHGVSCIDELYVHHERHYSIQLVGSAKESGTRERAAEGSRRAETGRIVNRITGVPRHAPLGVFGFEDLQWRARKRREIIGG